MDISFVDVSSENIKLFFPDAEKWVVDDLASGRFLAIGAMDQDSVAGVIVYTVWGADDSGNMGVLYYLDGDRAVMKELLDEYRRRCYRFNIQSTVVEFFDKESADYLTEYGFDMEEGESIFVTFNVSELEKITPLKELKIPAAIRPLSQVSPIEFRCFLEEYCKTINEGPISDMASMPMAWFDNDTSSVCIDDNGINAAFLVRFDGEKTVTAELLGGFGDNFTKKIPYLLAHSATNALYTYTPDTEIIICRHSDMINKITDKLLHGLKGVRVYHGVMMEDYLLAREDGEI